MVAGAIQYRLPTSWIHYDYEEVKEHILNAQASIRALQAIPYQRRWAKELQEIKLKLEISGTSMIEGADFLGDELDQAVRAATPGELQTRSQKQANAALRTYKWIRDLPDDMPVTTKLIKEIHHMIVKGCDDDHCPPSRLRSTDQYVTFGTPRHRGVTGGIKCAKALSQLATQIESAFREHDRLVQAIAAHYHFAAMHPFLDGNGRTARAIEALMMQRAGLRNVLFIPMSNYYHDNKDTYLRTLATVRREDHDLTKFLVFALKGVEQQASRLANELGRAVRKELFRSFMGELFVKLESTRKRVIVKRQLTLLNYLLDNDGGTYFPQLLATVKDLYKTRKDPWAAMARDINRLIELGAIEVRNRGQTQRPSLHIAVNLDWPSTLTDTEFFERLKQLPRSKPYRFLRSSS